MSPYEILGVPRDATLAQIRKAYRTLAKTMHPDVGGDAAHFERLKGAAELLADPARRKVFDETGEWQEKQPDNDHRPVMLLLAQAFDQVISGTQDPSKVDFVLEMATLLGNRRNNIEKGRRELPQMAAKLRKLRGRFRRKRKHQGEPNYLESLVNSRVQAVEAQLTRMEEEDALTLKAMKVLDTFSFMVDTEMPSLTQEHIMAAIAKAMQGMPSGRGPF